MKKSVLDGVWTECLCLLPRLTVEGTWRSGPLMRARINGVWHYRERTQEERSRGYIDTAW